MKRVTGSLAEYVPNVSSTGSWKVMSAGKPDHREVLWKETRAAGFNPAAAEHFCPFCNGQYSGG